MKKTVKLLKIAFLLIFVGSFAATTKAADTPEQAAKNFYQFYLKEISRAFSDEQVQVNKKKGHPRFFQRNSVKWYQSKAYEEYGADYFFDAQDFDEKWQVSTTKAVIKGNTADAESYF